MRAIQYVAAPLEHRVSVSSNHRFFSHCSLMMGVPRRWLIVCAPPDISSIFRLSPSQFSLRWEGLPAQLKQFVVCFLCISLPLNFIPCSFSFLSVWCVSCVVWLLARSFHFYLHFICILSAFVSFCFYFMLNWLFCFVALSLKLVNFLSPDPSLPLHLFTWPRATCPCPALRYLA